MGAARKIDWLAKEGVVCSFRKSLRASARGWGMPVIDTLFGPFRD